MDECLQALSAGYVNHMYMFYVDIHGEDHNDALVLRIYGNGFGQNLINHEEEILYMQVIEIVCIIHDMHVRIRQCEHSML